MVNETHTKETRTALPEAYRHLKPAEGIMPRHSEAVILPLPPLPHKDDTRFDMEVYARFMRDLRQSNSRDLERAVYLSIQHTAELMDTSDALVAKILIDLGLRAPRSSFPETFLEFADDSLQRRAWESGSAPASLALLGAFWQEPYNPSRRDQTQQDGFPTRFALSVGSENMGRSPNGAGYDA